MMQVVDFAYAGARIQARHASRVPASQWERLQRIEGLAAFLQAARDTGLRAWTLQLDAAADAHQIEAHLRLLFRRHVAELAQWAPPAWRPAIEWCAVLPDLPAIVHRLRGGEALPWMAADARLGELAGAGRPRLSAELKLFAPRDGELPDPVATWLARWRELWPAPRADERRALEALVRVLREAMAAAARDAPAASARLRQPLRRLFRRHARAPAGVFVHLVLAWQELMTLRGALLRRRLALPIEGAAP